MPTACFSSLQTRWILILILLFSVTPLWAQKDTGNIAGVVKDSSGAIVPGAKVTVTDVDRATSLVTRTNQQGEYVAGPLKVGSYRIVVEKQGFKRSTAGPVKVDVQARPAVDFTLQVGSISETLTVTTQGPQLETDTSSLGQVQDSQTIETLPLNGRNYAQLALLSAGVATAEPGSRVETTFGFSSNGSRSLQNNFQLDGVDNNSDLGDVSEWQRICNSTVGRCDCRIQSADQCLQRRIWARQWRGDERRHKIRDQQISWRRL